MIRCHRCGRELEESLSFCPYCGAAVTESSNKLRYIDEDDEQETTILQLSKDQLRALGGPVDVEGAVARVEMRGPAGGLIQTIPLSKGIMGIGRGSDQYLRVVDRTASRCHAEIRFDDGKFHVRDVGSANGTRLNGEPLEEERELTDQARIEIGRHTLIFLIN
ncbi:MAG: FHA domain-containing protein [Armatimonadetes bacterium]|nr:FHA domain-containing protein [Armatimonadota bacterium]